MIKGLHHNAYRCRDSEETRVFYEDFLGLKLVSAFEIGDGMGLHTFFAMDEGSGLALFEGPRKPFDLNRPDGVDLHIRPRGRNEFFDAMLANVMARGHQVP